MTHQDAGTKIVWVLDTNCHFGADVELRVVTTEDGVERDVYTTHGWAIEGQKTGTVALAKKPLCARSTVRVVASYKYMSIGDRQSTERVVYYDPNDNCGA